MYQICVPPIFYYNHTALSICVRPIFYYNQFCVIIICRIFINPGFTGDTTTFHIPKLQQNCTRKTSSILSGLGSELMKSPTLNFHNIYQFGHLKCTARNVHPDILCPEKFKLYICFSKTRVNSLRKVEVQ